MATSSNGASNMVDVTHRPKDTTIRKRCRIPGNKVCAVCGDKALAHHFSALACESCKAFFRRNAFRRHDLRPCSAPSSCQITKDNRRSCPCCRLAKCFDVGMKPELIYDEHQKKDLMEKVRKTKLERQARQPSAVVEPMEENPSFVSSTGPDISHLNMGFPPDAEGSHGNGYAQKHVDSNESDDLVAVTDDTVVRWGQIARGGGEMSKGSDLSGSDQVTSAFGKFCSMKSSCQQTHKSEWKNGTEEVSMVPEHPSGVHPPTGSSGDMQSSSCVSQTSLLVEQRKPSAVDLGTLTRDELPSDPHMYRRLSEEERMLLSRLSCAYEDTMLSNFSQGGSFRKLDSSNYSAIDSLADYEVTVRHATDIAKRLDDFQRLDFEDRIACFKTSVDCLVAVYNSYVFVAERNSWLMVKGEVSFDLMAGVFPDYPFTEWRANQCRELKSLAKNDVNIYCLLHCILLFNPSGEMISDRQLVSSLRDKYMILLRHYLEAAFSFVYSEDYFRQFQKIVVEIQDQDRADRAYAAETNCHLSEEFVPFELLLELHTNDR